MSVLTHCYLICRVKLAVKQTHYLAVRHYHELEVASSCVAFLELMGEQTLSLRLLINAAQIIHEGRLMKNPSLDTKALHTEIGENILLLHYYIILLFVTRKVMNTEMVWSVIENG